MIDDRQIKQIRLLRDGAAVERCHFIRHVGTYSVAEHTFGMMVLLMVLHPRPSTDLIRAITFHDAGAEAVIGDLPHRAKEFEDLAIAYDQAQEMVEKREGFWVNLGAEDRSWLRGLDVVEFFLWTEDQLSLGNKFARPKYEEAHSYLRKMIKDYDLPDELRQFAKYLIGTSR